MAAATPRSTSCSPAVTSTTVARGWKRDKPRRAVRARAAAQYCRAGSGSDHGGGLEVEAVRNRGRRVQQQDVS
jgi:hypothetical protein